MPILLIVAFLALILQAIVTVFITEKDVKYTLKTKDNAYTISERLEVIDGVSFYDFGVFDENGHFYSFSISNDFNKQTEVIKDIKYFKSNDVTCVFPIYKRNKTGDVACLYKGEAVSYSYLKQIGNEDIDGIVSKLKKKKYNHNSWDRKLSEKVNLFHDGRGIDVYQENILKDYVFLIWRYKGLYILKNEESVIKDYLDVDQYDNNMSVLVGKYYVSAAMGVNETKVSELSYYNTKELGKGKIPLPDSIGSNIYFNGVYDDKLYMTDVDNKKQYTIDPAFEKVKEVGNTQDKFTKVVNGKIKKIAADKFLKNPVYFTNVVTNKKISTKYGSDIEVYKDRQFYYFKTKDGGVYRSHVDSPARAELLFKFDNLTEWKINNGDVIAVAGDTVYFYTDSDGLIPIAVNSELKYNHKNIVDFWREK